MPDLDKLIGDLAAEHDSLDAIVRDLPAERWDTPTPAVGWSVRDQISHLGFFDDQARLAVEDPDEFARRLTDIAADPDRFVAAIAEIDRNLQARAEELLRTRERIARLGAGDRLFVSAEVADYLDQLHELGVSQRAVQMERDLWILAQAVSPKEAAVWIADKRDAIGDPEFRAIYLEYDAAFDWSPDDPRLYALVDRSQRWLANRHARSEGGERSFQNPAIAQLVATSVGPWSPAWDRLAEIAKERMAGG